MKWLMRILGVLLLLVSAALVVLLVFTGLELQADLAGLLRRGWLLIVMGLVSAALGVYMLRLAGRARVPTEPEE